MENIPTPRSEHIEILFRWIRYSAKFNLSDILKKHNIDKIAIYGGGVLGVALYENLAASLDIKYIIDRNPELSFHYDGIQVILPEQTELLGDLDAVIVSIIDYYSVEEQLGSHVKCLSLYDIILDIDEYMLFEKTIQHAKASGATLLLADLTAPLFHIKSPSFFEKIVKFGGLSYFQLCQQNIIVNYYDDLDCCSFEYCQKISNPPLQHIRMNGVIYLNDVNSEFFNVINHCRVTTDVPYKYDNTIHFFGNCLARGLATEDQYTVESYLQRMLNVAEGTFNNKIFRVLNHGIIGVANHTEYLLNILNTSFQPGDYVVLISKHLLQFKFYNEEDETVKYLNLSNAFDRPHEFSGEIFFDNYHMNHRGYKLLAKKLYSEFEKLLDSESNAAVINKPHKEIKPKGNSSSFSRLLLKKGINNSEYKGLDKYLNLLCNEKVDISGVIGSIVMNCNPFTLGHRYLIEEANKYCDFLYIFIVEENKSYFPFADRFGCVKEGVADLENVKVLPSGKFIISALTFPEYFIKESSNVTIDASLDVKLFAESIAPILNIKKRFVGQEPFCQITRQYNRAMEEILPQHGIEFVMFERKEANSVPISASKVRELLNNKEFEELRMLVPESTYKYLLRVAKTL